jgi:hypothetical protein
MKNGKSATILFAKRNLYSSFCLTKKKQKVKAAKTLAELLVIARREPKLLASLVRQRFALFAQ